MSQEEARRLVDELLGKKTVEVVKEEVVVLTPEEKEAQRKLVEEKFPVRRGSRLAKLSAAQRKWGEEASSPAEVYKFNPEPRSGFQISLISDGKNVGLGYNAYHHPSGLNKHFLFGQRGEKAAYDAAFSWLEQQEAMVPREGSTRQHRWSDHRANMVRRGLLTLCGKLENLSREELLKECEVLGIELPEKPTDTQIAGCMLEYEVWRLVV